MSELADLLERFRRGAELLAMTMTGCAGAELDFVPAPDRWSVRQIICHLADSEMAAAVRFRQVIAEEQPLMQYYDEKAWAVNLDYSKRKASPVIESFRRIRGENYELLKDLSEDVFQRTGRHSQKGLLTLLDLLKLYTVHAEKHSEQVRAVRAAYKESKAKAQG